MIEEYTVIDVEVEWGESSASTRKRKISIQLQGKKQERISVVKASELQQIPLTNFGDVFYFIHQNLDETPANEQNIIADGGSTEVQLDGGVGGGEFCVLPKIGPQTNPTAPEKGYVNLSHIRKCNNIVIGERQSG